MSTLKEKAEAILQEKNTKIIPENFSENLEILGIQGDISTYESGSGNLQFTENVVDLPDNNQFIMEIENGSNVLYKEGSNMGLAALKSVVAQTIGLTANKIKKNETILGITGTYEGIDTSDANATANDILETKTAYVDGEKITGTIHKVTPEDNSMAGILTVGTWTDDGVYLYHKLENASYNGVPLFKPGYYQSITSNGMLTAKIHKATLAAGIGLTEDKIKKGETICGVTGTYEGGGSATSIDTTLKLQVGSQYGSSDIEYMTYENFKQATFDLTQLYNWNRNSGNGTPISQTILEMPYVYLYIGYMHQSYELEAGIEVDYKFVATSKPIISRIDEHDNIAQIAKDCYYCEMANGFFTNVEYNPDTEEDYVPEEKNYTTFEEFWTDFCNTIYEETSYKCIKPQRIADYSITSYVDDGYLFSNV